MKHEFLSISEQMPPGFSKAGRLSGCTGAFIVLYDDDDCAAELFHEKGCRGMVVRSSQDGFSLRQVYDAVWSMTVPASLDAVQIKPVCNGCLTLLEQQLETEKQLNMFRSMFRNTKMDNRKYSSYSNTVRSFLYTRLQEQNEWMISALTELVNFAVIKFEPADIAEYPRLIIDFLASDLFDLSYVSVMRLNEDEQKWDFLVQSGEQDIDLDIPPFEMDTNIEEERELYNFFSVRGETFLIAVSCVSTSRSFRPSEYTFFSLFVALVSSFYHQKSLAQDIEQRVTEINKLRLSKSIIDGLSDDSLSVKEAFEKMYELLSLEGLVLALYDDKHDDMKLIFQSDAEHDSWENFLSTVYGSEAFFADEWMLYPLLEEGQSLYGAVAARLKEDNVTLGRIQKKVLTYTIPQVTTILTRKRFHTQAITDPLTGAYNRRYGFQMLKERINMAMNNPEKTLSVAMLDIDFFKKVNDTYGHQAGDEVLKTMVKVMKHLLRDTDIVCRYGGEEFLLIMPADGNIVTLVMERVRKKVEDTVIHTEKHRINVTVSIGAWTYSRNIHDPEKLIEKADVNLYRAKDNGRNRVIAN